jgi:hypothetical protein
MIQLELTAGLLSKDDRFELGAGRDGRSPARGEAARPATLARRSAERRAAFALQRGHRAQKYA